MSHSEHVTLLLRSTLWMVAALLLLPCAASASMPGFHPVEPRAAPPVPPLADQYWPPYPWEKPDLRLRDPALRGDTQAEVPWANDPLAGRREADALGPASPFIRVSADSLGLHWRVTSLHTYAAKLCTITVSSPMPVIMTVGDASGDARSEAGSAMPLSYGFGETIGEVEGFGWIAAAEISGMAFPHLFERPSPNGQSISVWVKMEAGSAESGPSYQARLPLAFYVER